LAYELTPRGRFARIMAHQEADRVPLDLGGTTLTSADPQVVAGLRRLLGMPAARDQGLDEPLMQALDVDFRHVGQLIGSGGRLLPGRTDRQVDIWGVERTWTGQYWDIVRSPLKGATLDDLGSFPWPDPAATIDEALLELFRCTARHLWEETDYVVVAEHPVFGVFELACWMCGFDDILARLVGDRPFVHALFKKLLALQKTYIKPYYQAVGQYIHLTSSGDDFGMQTGPFMAPRTFRELIKPYFAERIAYTREFTPAYYWHHTCGSVHDLVPDLIDIGVSILNPIQPGAYKMEPERLKADYGDRLVFHGGFDTQAVLPFGTLAQIEAEVQRVMAAMKPGGGYVFSAAHNIQSDVPPENVLTMLHAAKRLGTYGPAT